MTKRVISVLLSVVLIFGITGVFASAASGIYISSYNYPSCISKGNTFSVFGTVSSDYYLTNVTVGIYNTSGTAIYKYTSSPQSTRFSVSNADSAMSFSRLDTGNYVYKITASTSSSSNVTVLSKNFKVIPAGTPESKLEKVSWKVYDFSGWDDFYSWEAFANDADAFIVRIGGTYESSKNKYEDSLFKTAYSKIKAYNKPLGVYYYSAATTVSEAVSEANYVMSILRKYNCKLEMPVYFDMETRAQENLSASQATEVARAFCEELMKNKYYPGFYANKYFATEEIYANQLGDIALWIAEYSSSCHFTASTYGMWQYSESGSVRGTYDPIDLNRCYYNYPKYIKANGYNGYTATDPTPVFNIKTSSSMKISGSNLITSSVGLSTDSFTSTYVNKSSNVTVSYGNAVSGKVTTGTTITAKSSSSTLGSYTVIVLGDVNSDAKLTSSDALNVLEYATQSRSLSNNQKLSADMNGDSKINSTDALSILKKIVG